MANRKPPPKLTPIQEDALEKLFNSCYLHGRPGIKPKKPPKIYFDAEMFRWYFAMGIRDRIVQATLTAGIEEGWSLKEIRNFFTNMMREQGVE